MKIGITLNEVIRNYNEQLQLVYEKYNVGDSKILDIEELTNLDDLEKIFPVEREDCGAKTLSELMYTSAAYEISGGAKETDPHFSEIFNEFVFDFYIHKNNSISFISKEFNRSINATLFFLSKTNYNVREIDIPENYKNIWEKYDVIITADPTIIETKPTNKILYKIKTPYNSHLTCENEFDSISSVFKEKFLQ